MNSKRDMNVAVRAGSVASGSGGEELDEWEVETNVAMTEYR